MSFVATIRGVDEDVSVDYTLVPVGHTATDCCAEAQQRYIGQWLLSQAIKYK